MKSSCSRHIPVAVVMLLAATATSQGSGTSAPVSSREGKTTIARMYCINEFAVGGFGYAGITSDGEKLFFRGLELGGRYGLVDLYQRGNTQAKAYALVGLRWLNAPEYKVYRDEFRSSAVPVVVQSGCIVRHQDASFVVSVIEAGAYDSYPNGSRERKEANSERSTNT
jgi:hypothetical protein